MAGKEDHACKRWAAACFFRYSCLHEARCSLLPHSGHDCPLQLPARQAQRKQMSTRRRDVMVVAAPIEQALPKQDSTGYNDRLSYRPFLAAHPAVASALGVLAFSLTQALDKTGSLFPCKIYTHTVRASLRPFHLSLGNRLTFLSPSFFPFPFQQSCSCKTYCISLSIPLTMAYLWNPYTLLPFPPVPESTLDF